MCDFGWDFFVVVVFLSCLFVFVVNFLLLFSLLLNVYNRVKCKHNSLKYLKRVKRLFFSFFFVCLLVLLLNVHNQVTCINLKSVALVCGILLLVCYFPIGILGRVWYLIVSIPDLCILTYLTIFIFIVLFVKIDPRHMNIQ